MFKDVKASQSVFDANVGTRRARKKFLRRRDGKERRRNEYIVGIQGINSPRIPIEKLLNIGFSYGDLHFAKGNSVVPYRFYFAERQNEAAMNPDKIV